MRRHSIYIQALILLLPFYPASVCADPFTLDQSNEPLPGMFTSIRFHAPIGQEFTPTQRSLEVVEFFTGNPFSIPGVTLFVNIRNGTINGPILGTSFILPLPDTFVGVTHFDFPSSVALVPGLLYVMEIQLASGENEGVFVGGPSYPGGRAIVDGVPALGRIFGFGKVRPCPSLPRGCSSAPDW
jgi:hypothetical protein